MPVKVLVTDAEIREALAEPLKTILRAIRETLDQIPPELSSDIYDRGVALCGGGSLLRNLDKRIRDETQLPVQMVDDPLSCVVIGAGKMLSDDTLLKKLGSIVTEGSVTLGSHARSRRQLGCPCTSVISVCSARSTSGQDQPPR